MLRCCQFLTILTSKSFSRAGAVQILSHLGPQILRTRPFLGPDFSSRRSHKTMEKHSISRTSYPPNPHVSHLCCITSAQSHLLIDRSSAATFSIGGSWIPKLPLHISFFGQTSILEHEPAIGALSMFSRRPLCCLEGCRSLTNSQHWWWILQRPRMEILASCGWCGF